jgi:macrolide transport system ATP-binding/permease protein
MLAALLLKSPDLLLLDEPTNHLDFASAAWLERYLSEYRGAFVAVSHDRHFLNRTVTRIAEIDDYTHGILEYPGNYDAYRAAKERDHARQLEAFTSQQEEMKELRRAIKVKARQVSHARPPTDNDKFANNFFREQVDRAVSRNVRNAEERLKRLEANPAPKPPRLFRINPDLDPAELRSDQAIVAERLTRRFGDRVVLDDISFTLGSRSRVVVVGENGAGKSTLLDLIAGRTRPDSGTRLPGPGRPRSRSSPHPRRELPRRPGRPPRRARERPVPLRAVPRRRPVKRGRTAQSGTAPQASAREADGPARQSLAVGRADQPPQPRSAGGVRARPDRLRRADPCRLP